MSYGLFGIYFYLKLQSVQSLLKKTLPLNEIGTILRQAFPHLAHVGVAKDSSKKIHIAIGMSKPLALCNESVVICSNDMVVLKDIFSHTVLENLPQYVVAQSQLDQPKYLEEFKQFIGSCDTELHGQYKIAWNSSQEIYFHDKNESKISLILDKESVKNFAPIKLAYNVLKQKIIDKNQQAHHQKNKKNTILAWNIDGRFKNQMIVVPKGVVG